MTCHDDNHLGRRRFLGQSLQAGAAASMAIARQSAQAESQDRLQIDSYVDQMSCQPGDVISLHVSTRSDRFSVDIVREGLRSNVVWSRRDLPGHHYPTPETASMDGCQWPAAVKIRVGQDWSSGCYRVVLRGEKNGTRTKTDETFFIVRAAQPGRYGKILLQVSTNTYQAYNIWGGSSLYSGPKYPRVSFDRPFIINPVPADTTSPPYNPNASGLHRWDLPFIRWAESAGYRIEYAVNLDLEMHPEILSHYHLILSVGHDEYWSAPMRDHLEQFISNGGNVAFFSGNTCCWQVRTEDDGRTLVSYKFAYEQDPVFKTGDHRLLTALWSDPLIGRPENQLTGVGFTYGGYNGSWGQFMSGPGSGTYTVHRPDHWLFAGTALKEGETFGRKSHIAGYECDGGEFVLQNGRPVPTGRDGTPEDFTILATAPARWSGKDAGSLSSARRLRQALPPGDTVPDNYLDRDGSAVVGLYTRGGTVVTVGSCDWSDGLQAGDRVVNRIVRNVLDRLSV